MIGVLPFLVGSEGITQGLVNLASRFGDEGIFAVPMPGGFDKVFVCSAAIADEALDDRTWEKAVDPLLLRVRRMAGDGLFTADGEDPIWGTAHRILSPAFSGSAMARYFPAKLEVLDQLVASWRHASDPVDVLADMTRLTLDTIALVGFDQRLRSFARSETDPFIAAFTLALDELIAGAFRPGLGAPIEALLAYRLEGCIRTLFERVDLVLAERRSTPRDRWPSDLLSRMLTERDPKSGGQLPHANIRYQILTFLLAGHETTSTMLSFALHYVARDPELAQRLAGEAEHVFGEGRPTFEQVRSLDLAGRVLDEALRLHPPAPFFMRKPKEDTLLAGRYPFTPKDDVAIMLPSLHRDPAVWREPHRFDPDRFLPDEVRARPLHAYRPFGTGKRICTGRNFALVEASLALAVLAREFEFDDPGPLRIRSAPIAKPRDFKLRVRRRRGYRNAAAATPEVGPWGA